MASYCLVSANVRAADGISNAPGTRTISISLRCAPDRRSPSQALCSSRSVMNALNRATTMANRRPVASSFPSSARNSPSAGCSTFNRSLFSVTKCLRGEAFNPQCPLCPLWLKPLDLLPFKRRRPHLQERRSPLGLILSSPAHSKQSSLQIKPLSQSHLHPFVHGLHRILHSQRSVSNNLRRNRLRPRNQLSRCDHFVDR